MFYNKYYVKVEYCVNS